MSEGYREESRFEYDSEEGDPISQVARTGDLELNTGATIPKAALDAEHDHACGDLEEVGTRDGAKQMIVNDGNEDVRASMLRTSSVMMKVTLGEADARTGDIVVNHEVVDTELSEAYYATQ